MRKRLMLPVLLSLIVAHAGAVESQPAESQVIGAPAEKNSPPVLRVGISSFALPFMRDPMEAALLSAFEKAKLAPRIEVRHYEVAALEKAVRAGAVDIFISSAGLARRLVDVGARPVATTVRPGLEDPNHNEGSAFIVRREDDRVKRLADLEGKRIVANLPHGFSGFQAAIGEIAALGFDPENFFGEERFFNRSDAMLDIAEAVAAGQADAGVLRLCAYEHLEAHRPALAAALRIMPPERPVEGEVACQHTTKLYPAQSISVMPTVSPAVSKALLVAVLTMAPLENGRSWSVATDFKGVDELLETLKIGPYAYLRDWTLKRFISVFWPYLAALAAAVAALAMHSRRADLLVARREKSLNEAYAREEAQRERISVLQRAGAVGQLSSLIAHEIHQPLASIRLYAEGLGRQAERGEAPGEKVVLACTRIAAEAQRAGDIVNRVREYARGRLSAGRSVRVSELIEHLRETYPGLMRRVTLRIASDDKEKGRSAPCASEPASPVPGEDKASKTKSAWSALLFGSAIELELALVNLLRNAVEAVKNCESPRVSLDVEADDSTVHFTIRDNGPALSDAAFAMLRSPVSSRKPEGLGLGLAITRSIIETHGGTLEFERASPQGLAACVSLPARQDEETLRNSGDALGLEETKRKEEP